MQHASRRRGGVARSRVLVGLATSALVVAVALPSGADPVKPGGEHPEQSALVNARTRGGGGCRPFAGPSRTP